MNNFSYGLFLCVQANVDDVIVFRASRVRARGGHIDEKLPRLTATEQLTDDVTHHQLC